MDELSKNTIGTWLNDHLYELRDQASLLYDRNTTLMCKLGSHGHFDCAMQALIGVLLPDGEEQIARGDL